MKPLKNPSKLSDRELSSMLKSLREDVAAPPAFRQQVMQRLAKEGIIAPTPQPAQLSWLQRLAAQFSAPRLGLAAGAACALALVLLNTHAPTTDGEPVLSEGAANSAVQARAEGPKESKKFQESQALQVASHKVKAADAAQHQKADTLVADATLASVPAAAPQAAENLKSEESTSSAAAVCCSGASSRTPTST